MNSILKIKTALLVILFGVTEIVAQNCPSLGPDQYLPCGVTQATLFANMTTCNPTAIQAAQTTTYSVSNIPFAPAPVGGTAVNLSDDSQAGPFNIGFTFCFFGNSYTQFWIGSNGWVSFSGGQSNAFTSAGIPSGALNVPKNCIMGPWQDWHPGVGPNVGNYIRYQVLGTAPCRRLVISYTSIPMYQCTTTYGTFQIILYESTNVIENHITNKPHCGWAGGTAVQGIHNLPGTIGITVPGRNSTVWTTTNDARRYTPSGAPVNPTLTWYIVGNPVPIGTGTSIVVNPPQVGEFYSCVPEYPACYEGFNTCVNNVSNNFPDTVFVQPGLAMSQATITAPTCINGPTQISVAPNSPTNNVLWSGPGIQGPNNVYTVTINAGGNYSVLISNTSNTCTSSASITIGQSPTLNVVASSNTMCANNFNNSLNSITLTASGAPGYTWTNFVGLVNTAPSTTNSAISFTPAPAAIIGSVDLIGSDGICTTSSTYTFVIIPNPPVSVNSPTVCQGGNVDLIATNGSTYTWSPAAGLSSTSGETVTAMNVAVNTIYSVIGSSLGCNSQTQNAQITVIPNPTVFVSPATNTICAGGSLALTAHGATNYTWTPPISLNVTNGSQVIASPLATTNYSVIGEQATCTNVAVYQVSVIVMPNVIVSASSNTICQYSNTNLNANGASNYTWSPAINVSSTAGNFITAYPNSTTIYTVIGTNGICPSTGTIEITVVPFPNLDINTSNYKICQTHTTSIFASGASNYFWQPPQGLSSTSNPVAQASPSISTNYTITGFNTNGSVTCSMTKEILIVVVPTVTASVSNSVQICAGKYTNLEATGSNTYSWFPSHGLNQTDIPTPVASPSITTLYTVEVSNSGDCPIYRTVLVQVNPTPTVFAGEDFAANLDEPMHLNANGTGTLTWIYGDGVLCGNCPKSQIMPRQSGCYGIEAVNEFNCKAQDEVCVQVTTNYNIYIPNIFTPNFDGLNDVFLVYGTGLSNFEMYIFDRWGEQLFVSKDQLVGWDGMYKGEMSKNDVYPYLIKFTSLDGKKRVKSGHVTLLK